MIRLFDPIRIGRLPLPNRIIMAPLTRGRAGGAGLPDALVAEYYAQRASAGLLIAEATSVTPSPKPSIHSRPHSAKTTSLLPVMTVSDR